MRILQVIPNLSKGGAQRLVIDICNEFIKHKQVTCKLLVLGEPNNAFSFCSSNLDITFCKVKFKLSILKKNNILIDAYEDFVDNFKPDIIHSHLYFAELVCHENPRKSINYISHIHSNNPVFHKLSIKNIFFKKNIFKTYEKLRLSKKYNQCNKNFIAISTHTYDYFRKNMPNWFKDLIKLPNAINLNRFKSNSKPPSLKKINMISVGNLFANKDQIFLIEILKYIKSKQYSVHLNIVGDGPEKNKILEKINSYNLGENITMSGQKDVIEKELKKANFYVHSATNEAFGLTIVEAMASKLAVIAFNGKGNEDIIENNLNGFIFNKKDPKMFGDVIIDLFLDKIRYLEIISEGFKKSLDYDISEYTDNLINIYKIKYES